MTRRFLYCLSAFVASFALRADPLDLWAVERALDARLSEQTISRVALALPDRPRPSDGRQALEYFFILHRAGYDEALRNLFTDLPALEPPLQRDTEENIDAWISRQIPGNPDYWITQRFFFAEQSGRQSQLVESYRARLQAAPDDLPLALELAKGFRREGRDSATSLDWIADVYRPGAASDAYQVGSLLRDKSPRAAAVLLRLALATPFSEKDRQYLRSHSASARWTSPVGMTEKDLRYSIKHALLSALRASGDAPAAQAVLEELAADADDGYSGVPLHLAGRVQAASGGRFVEGRIREAETKPENQNSPRYWRERGEYFSGRREWVEALAAYRRALELCPPPSRPDTSEDQRSAEDDTRYGCALGAARVLDIQGDRVEAAGFLMEELARWPSDHPLVERLVAEIGSEYLRGLSNVSDREPAVLWDYFAGREEWSRAVEVTLHAMAEAVDRDLRQDFWDRAEELAAGNASRCAVLGWVMNRCGESPRALPSLEYAVAHLPAGEKRAGAVWTLWETVRDLRQWQAAERILDNESMAAGLDERLDGYASIARGLLKEGNKADAVRVWGRIVEQDRSYAGFLDELAAGGLREELVELYAKLSVEEPACVAAGIFVRRLASPP